MIQEENIFISIEDNSFNVEDVVKRVQSNSSGAEVIFIGKVRNHSKGKSITRLDYSAYESMAISEIKKIVEVALNKFEIDKIAVSHRVGKLEIGDLAVVIAVSSAHRTAGFKANQFIIDEIKKTVPIWKKEYTEEGEVWVNANP